MTRLGADLGATWLRVCLVRPGRPPRRARTAAVPWRRAPEALRRLLRRLGAGRLDALALGGTRLGEAQDRAALEAALRPLARRARVLADFELAHLAAFGAGPGVVLVAGTGSVAFARGAGGRTRRAGGLGPLFGDEGSGFWLGREAARDARLRAALRLPAPLDLAHAADPVRATAALAPRVLAAARRPDARRLRGRAAACLAALAREAGRGLPRPAPLALHGGLFRDAGLKAEVLRRLGRGWRLWRTRRRPERAAAEFFVK